MTSIYIPFKPTGDTFEARIGPPDELTSALGYVVVGFGWLEEALCKHIAALSELSPEKAAILTSEMSFKTRVHALSSLVRHLAPTRPFNVGKEDTLEMWEDLVKMLFTCEELRNRILHSTYHLAPFDRKRGIRKKITAKASRGLKHEAEEASSDFILDAYDYELCVVSLLDEFFLT